MGPLPDGTDVDRLVRECEIRRPLIAPGQDWFPAEPSSPYIRLNFAVDDQRQFNRAAELLAEALREAVDR